MQNNWKCLNEECGKEFRAIDGFECFPGQKHVVPEKTYYINDAPAGDDTGVSFRKSTTEVHNIPPERTVVDEGGKSKTIFGGSVKFVRGQLTTNDPEQQFWIEKTMRGLITKEQWEQVYFSTREKLALSESRAAMREAEAERKIREANELLAMAKEKVGKAKG